MTGQNNNIKCSNYGKLCMIIILLNDNKMNSNIIFSQTAHIDLIAIGYCFTFTFDFVKAW